MKFEKYSKPNKIPNYIIIKKSTVDGAGKGAFANVDIPKGKVIGEYVGKVYKEKDLDNANGDYLFSVRHLGKEVKIIDGRDWKKSSWVRFVNTPQTQDEGNAYFFQYEQRIFLKTFKDIPEGQEIFAYYGDEYINERLKKFFTDENKPKINTKIEKKN
jgi:hypothetical protein